MSTTNRNTPIGRVMRGALAGSALAFGVLGWSVAHLLTGWLLAHRHSTAHGTLAGVAHVHATDTALTLLSLVLLATSLLAVVCAPGRAGSTARSLARWMSIGSTGTFLAAEFVAYAASDTHVVPPPVVLLAGAAVHALCGSFASLLWRHSVSGLLRLVVGLLRDDTPIEATTPIPGYVAPASAAQRWPMLRVAGRGPPVLAFVHS